MANAFDFLKGDLSEVRVGVEWSQLSTLDIHPDLYLSQRRMADDLLCHRRVYALTYSYSEHNWLSKSGRLAKLVVGIKMRKREVPTGTRYHYHLHSKLFLGINRSGHAEAAYIGSQNLVGLTVHNLTVRIKNRAQLSTLTDYFNLIWNQAKPL